MSKLKGFIGPLGDDIPSIFPIVAGILLFIGSILYVNAQVDGRNFELREREAAQNLAYLATKKAHFQAGEFQALCKNSLQPFAENNNLKFAVVVKRFCGVNAGGTAEYKGCPSCSAGIDLVNSNVFNEDEIAGALDANVDYVCTNENAQVKADYVAARLDQTQSPSNAIILLYPFTTPCPDSDSPENGLATLNVIVWR